ncbi:response regulator [Mucilaginibacter sp. KACC 22063]|uniref:response regulator n=1 Tax=Mucilaginibacter sp. KACC 22063 TaxID=3025666 RepID=UPI002365837A|nr:response regulator [Mucilaginibacter sp. KACC 22063]WDF54317.1 response regulator [Mucilaginibacter sp. KACC 22063]
MKTTITRNLQIGFGLSLLLLIISSVVSYVSISNLLQSSERVDHSNTVVSSLENVISTMKDAETGQRGFLLTSQNEFLEPYNGSYNRALLEANKAQNLTKDNPQQQKNIKEIKDILLQRMSILQKMIDKKRAGGVITVDELRTGKLYMDSLRKAVDETEKIENKILKGRIERLNQFSSFTPIVIVFAAILSLVISGFFYLKVTSDLAERNRLQRILEEKDQETQHRINVIQGIADKVSNGDYSTRVDASEKDTLGSLAVSLNKMAESLQYSFNKISDNEWLQTGIAQLNDRMVGEKDLKELSKDILDFIADYTKSQVGALYTFENKTLHLESGYALSSTAPKIIKAGEGLLGQVAESGKPIFLSDIDPDYISVNYASGSIKPKNLIIVPLFEDTKVHGVLELGTLNEYPARKLEFLKAVSGNIGIALVSSQNRRRMQELLEETQAQSEELQAQHSELENLNNELEEHTQRLQTSEEELRVQQEELQQTNQELEERNRIINDRNAEIQRKAEELEQTTKYKSEFMANMSHELRTPLNSILLLSRYLSENTEHNLSEEQVESARVILNSGNGLLDLIDELLDLSKIEAGKMDLEYEQVPLAEIEADMRSLFMPIARDRNLQLILDNHFKGNETLETDKMRLEQVIKNLMSNALKFTTQGSVQLSIRPSTIDNSFIEFSVKDTGVGIPQEKQELVFEAFKQADGSTKRKFGGTGLGLSISRELARLLGGEIRLESEPGKGSNFIVIIPRHKPATVPLPVPPQPIVIPAKTEEKKEDDRVRHIAPVIPGDVEDDRNTIGDDDKVILIIEDDTPFAKALLGFTRQRGYKGVISVRGDLGIEYAIKYRPLAILLDLQLPVKDGWEVMEELKSNPVTKPIPVHIMSSMEAKKESRLRGAVDFINKPVAIEQMKLIFSRLEDALSRSPKKVLIVEENPKHAQALAYFLETFNVSAAVSSSVSDGVSILQNKQVDCVILDMGIPDKSAYETLDLVKQNKGLEHLPIIVFTGKNLSSSEETRIKQYADSIVIKTAHSYQRILDEVALFLHLIEENKQEDFKPKNLTTVHLNEVLHDKTVLIADDDVRNIFSLTKSLEKHKMNVISATDGREALKQLEENPDTAIVLMDMMMPEMDGYESTKKIRQNPKFKNLPVIAVTAKAMMGDREKCIQAGASDYISKPVDIDQLISLLRVWLYDKAI